MGESLNQPSRVKEDGARRRKLLLAGKKGRHVRRGVCARAKKGPSDPAGTRAKKREARVILGYMVFKVRIRVAETTVQAGGSKPANC